jgi:hypothetical protein
MNRYQPNEPRLVLGLAAMIMSALTIGLLVVVPSKMEPDSQAFAMLTTANSTAVDPCANPALLRCIDPSAWPNASSAVEPKCKEQS